MVHCGLQKQSSISRPTRPSVNRASNIAESGKPTPLAFPGFKTCIQAKLRINPPDDAYEREADRMSEHVTSGPGHSIAAKPVPISRIGMVQRACACGGTCANCKDNSEDEHLQRKSPPAAAANDGVPAIVDEALRAPGQPLDGVTRVSMERRFGYDFSKVRVHTDSLAERSARAIQARAFTVGHHLVFDAGGYNTHTPSGRRLLAHELTHTVQQGAASQVLQRDPNPDAKEEPCPRGQMRMGKGIPCFPVTLPGRDCPVGQIKFGGNCVPLPRQPSPFENKLTLDPKFMPPEPSTPGGLHLDPTLTQPGAYSAGQGSPGTSTGSGTGAGGCKYSVKYANPVEVDCDTVWRAENRPRRGPLCGKRVIYEITNVSVSPASCPLAGLTVSERVATVRDGHSCTPSNFTWPQPTPCTIGAGGTVAGCTDTLTMCGLTSDLHFGGCEENVKQDILVDGKPVETHIITFELDKNGPNCTGTVTRK
jgi:hypothetical protein